VQSVARVFTRNDINKASIIGRIYIDDDNHFMKLMAHWLSVPEWETGQILVFVTWMIILFTHAHTKLNAGYRRSFVILQINRKKYKLYYSWKTLLRLRQFVDHYLFIKTPPIWSIKWWCASDVWCLTTSVCLSRTSGLSREQIGLGRLKLAQR